MSRSLSCTKSSANLAVGNGLVHWGILKSLDCWMGRCLQLEREPRSDNRSYQAYLSSAFSHCTTDSDPSRRLHMVINRCIAFAGPDIGPVSRVTLALACGKANGNRTDVGNDLRYRSSFHCVNGIAIGGPDASGSRTVVIDYILRFVCFAGVRAVMKRNNLLGLSTSPGE